MISDDLVIKALPLHREAAAAFEVRRFIGREVDRDGDDDIPLTGCAGYRSKVAKTEDRLTWICNRSKTHLPLFTVCQGFSEVLRQESRLPHCHRAHAISRSAICAYRGGATKLKRQKEAG